MSNNQKIAYLRVSSVSQNEARQREAMQDKGINKYFVDKCSGKDTNRPQLQEMLDYVREGDIVYIHEFSRLARNTADLLKIVEYLTNKGVTLISNKENLDTSTSTGKLMLTIIGAIAEFERACIRERQLEGIAIAKREGKFKGGQVKRIDDKTFNKYYQQYQSRQINKVQFAKALNISRPTLDKILKERATKESEV